MAKVITVNFPVIPMQSNLDTQANWSQHDDNCSKSCTRSGVAVLLLSAFAISILPSLGKMESLNALLGYISRRITLKEEVTRLGSDPVWNRLTAADPSAKNWRLDKIVSYRENAKPKSGLASSVKIKPGDIPSASASKHVTPRDNISPSKSETESPKGPLRAPTGVTVRNSGSEIEPVYIIIKTLEELADFDFLRSARNYSYRYDVSLYRWALLLYKVLGKVSHSGPSKLEAGKSPFAEEISKLTLDRIEELANFNLPDISEADRLEKEASFMLPPIGTPLGLTSATFFIEVALLFLTSYWWIWYREARLSPNFPVSGTLFGAFARSAFSRFIFFLLIALPPIAAALVAWRTLWIGYANAMFATLITIVVFRIRREGELTHR